MVEKLNRVNYRVKDQHKKEKGRIVHVNNLKKWVEREDSVRRLVVVGEEELS